MDEGAAILAIGDVHLGTACSGVPEDVSSWGVDGNELTPAAALRASVEFAIEQEVDAVLFAGDVVESTNARFEAMVPLEECIRRLLDAGIQVIAVAGNHDFEALPRLASLIDGFTLLGAGGEWESRVIERDGAICAEVIGWSFSERRVRHSPVAQLLSEPIDSASPAVPRIGLLHADLNASGGSYAPIRQAELDEAGFDAWLLGHIHKPSIESLSSPVDGRPQGYLGSLVGLDSSETCPHGPWLLSVRAGGKPRMEHVPLAPLRWEHVPVSVDRLEHVEDVPDLLLREAECLAHKIRDEGPVPRALGLRVQLTGASSRKEEIRQRITVGEWKNLSRVVDGTAVFFNKIIDAISVRLELEEIADGEDPPALIAQRLLSLGRGDARSDELLEQARAALSDIAGNDRWRPVQNHRNAADPLADAALREILFRSGMAALALMLSRTEQSE